MAFWYLGNIVRRAIGVALIIGWIVWLIGVQSEHRYYEQSMRGEPVKAEQTFVDEPSLRGEMVAVDPYAAPRGNVHSDRIRYEADDWGR